MQTAHEAKTQVAGTRAKILLMCLGMLYVLTACSKDDGATPTPTHSPAASTEAIRVATPSPTVTVTATPAATGAVSPW